MSVNSFDGYPLSWRPNKSALSQPYYLSLAADLEQQIRSGTLLPGTQLPPQEHLRVSLCSAGDMRHLEKGLTILRTYLDELK